MHHFAAICLALVLLSCTTTSPPIDVGEPVRTPGRPLVLAHFMPWFQAPPTSKSFGWHWHMGFFDPYEAPSQGRVPLATHTYPLTGPYDSSDPAILEYQLSLMKLAGIDGVIIDWYGIEDALDYAKIHQASQALVAALHRAHLKFAVCWEDQSIGKMVLAKKVAPSDALDHGRAALQWLDEHWFHDEAYVTLDGRPLLLDFGPQTFLRASDWDALFGSLSARPYFASLDNHLEFYSDTSYPWPPMYLSSEGRLSLERVADYFSEFYRKSASKTHLITTVFPGFHDMYQEAGVATSYGYLDDQGGQTFRVLLDAALRARPDVIQLATWNDYGEGTVLEPNAVRGYGPLVDLQRALATPGSAPAVGADDLGLPLKVLQLRRAKTTGPTTQQDLDRAVDALYSQRFDEYRTLVRRL